MCSKVGVSRIYVVNLDMTKENKRALIMLSSVFLESLKYLM